MDSEAVLDQPFGLSFLTERRRRGLTQLEAVKVVGLSRFHIWEIERGIIRPHTRAKAERFMSTLPDPIPPPSTSRPHPDVLRLLARATTVDDVATILRMAHASGITLGDLTR